MLLNSLLPLLPSPCTVAVPLQSPGQPLLMCVHSSLLELGCGVLGTGSGCSACTEECLVLEQLSSSGSVMLLQEPVGEISPLGHPGMGGECGCSPGLTVQRAHCPLDWHGNSHCAAALLGRHNFSLAAGPAHEGHRVLLLGCCTMDSTEPAVSHSWSLPAPSQGFSTAATKGRPCCSPS